MNVFHVCLKCKSKKLKLDSLKRVGNEIKINIRCDDCQVKDSYMVSEENFVTFSLSPEVLTLFGPITKKKKVKQETLW